MQLLSDSPSDATILTTVFANVPGQRLGLCAWNLQCPEASQLGHCGPAAQWGSALSFRLESLSVTGARYREKYQVNEFLLQAAL